MRSVFAVALCFLSGCAFFEKPSGEELLDIEIQDFWANVSKSNVSGVATGWLATFNDPAMQRLVAEAIEHNRDLRVTAAQLTIAKEQTILSRSARLPSVSASGSASGTGVRIRDDAGNLEPWVNAESYGGSLAFSWEVDLWGRLRNLHRASLEDYAATSADFRGARLSLAARTAKAWCNIIAAGKQVKLAEKTRDLFSRNYSIIERNYKAAGDSAASALSVQFGRNNVASAERSLISRQLSLGEAKRSLEVLLGRYPAGDIEGREDLPTLREAVPAGLPSDLLMRRPDLVAAAADLRASVERADAARKDLLPSLSLTARGSIGSAKLVDLVADPGSIARNVAASISQPIFQSGALNSRARQALARNEAAIESFSAIALRAFREVESALARESSLAAQEGFLEIELKQAELAEDQASRDYAEGVVGILEVLEAQRRAFSARSSMINLQNERLQTRIDLYLALGGDFEVPPQSERDGAALSLAEPDMPVDTDF